MELFKERLLDSFIVFMIFFFLAAVVFGVVANQLWIFGVLLAVLILCAAVKWIHWQFIEPFKLAKAEKVKKGL